MRTRFQLHPLLGLASCLCLGLATSACDGARVSDDSISESVSNRLEAEQTLAPFDLEVDAEDGIVTLEGSVAAESQRMEAERIARSTAGVQGVSNQIEVGASMTAPDVGAPGVGTPGTPRGPGAPGTPREPE